MCGWDIMQVIRMALLNCLIGENTIKGLGIGKQTLSLTAHIVEKNANIIKPVSHQKTEKKFVLQDTHTANNDYEKIYIRELTSRIYIAINVY